LAILQAGKCSRFRHCVCRPAQDGWPASTSRHPASARPIYVCASQLVAIALTSSSSRYVETRRGFLPRHWPYLVPAPALQPVAKSPLTQRTPPDGFAIPHKSCRVRGWICRRPRFPIFWSSIRFCFPVSQGAFCPGEYPRLPLRLHTTQRRR
jgi:hypothetical protein